MRATGPITDRGVVAVFDTTTRAQRATIELPWPVHGIALGPDGRAVRRTSRPRPTAPRLADVSARLSDRFETRVKVDLGRSKGKITVEFATLEDLERIVGLMDPQA